MNFDARDLPFSKENLHPIRTVRNLDIKVVKHCVSQWTNFIALDNPALKCITKAQAPMTDDGMYVKTGKARVGARAKALGLISLELS